MKRLTLSAFGVLVASLFVSGFGCELLTAPDRTKIDTGGSGGTTSTTGGGTAGTTGGTGGTTGGTGGTGGTTGGGGTGGMPCATPADCPDTGNPCIAATCVDTVCGTEPVAAGTQAGNQVTGDCKVSECNGAGTLELHADDTDLPDDTNECTDDTCAGGEKVFTPVTAGGTCNSGAGTLCDGAGNCVQCLVASDCTGSDTECHTRTCDAGVCGVSNAMQGSPVASQTEGDCKKNQCDGNGGIEAVPDDLDVVNDGNDCTDNTCDSGTPQIANTLINTPCGANGSLKCDGNGACVGCTEASDCGTGGNACLDAACNAGTCGTTPKADGTACDDSDACSQTDTCQAGACTGANPVVCSAQDQCHDAGTCNPATGACTNPAKADGASCSDGDLCTQADTCQAGACQSGAAVTCSAQDQCHDAGTCNPATGACTNPAKANDTPCNDSDLCTQTDTCQAGACTGASPVVCAAQDQCHDAGTCVPATGVCTNPNKADGSSCNDSDLCTQTDTCQAGACAGANPVVCVAPDDCHDAGACNPATGTCDAAVPKADGSPCSDGNACTATDTCQAGACTGANPVVCVAPDDCHDAGTCNPATGACENPPAKSDGTGCNDNNACTLGDTCQSGTCTGASTVVCSALDQCHDAGTCNPATGVCTDPNKADGSACNDNDACTQTDTCQSGACSGGNPVVCAPLDACHLAGACDSGTGLCTNPVGPDNTPCAGGFCQAGTCTQTCTNSTQDGLETGTDCGGTCPDCPNGQGCLIDGDCQSGHCLGNVCVECAAATDCPGVDNECGTRTCDAGTHTCGMSLQPNGTPTATQVTGDCKQNECDGAGAIVSVNFDSDLPVDNNQCTGDVCTAGAPTNPALPVNTACSQNGGTKCDGAGNCVVAPSIVSTTPADGAANVSAGAAIAVTFSKAMNPTTITGQTAIGACSGSVQLSVDDFASCLPFASATPAMTGGSTVATFTPAPGMSYGTTYKVRVLGTVADSAGVTMGTDFTMPSGFATGTDVGSGTSVVISQVYGGGGNTGAQYQRDFIELHNRGPSDVNIGGWAVQWASASGSTWAATVIPANTTLAAGKYFLIEEGAGNGNGVPLPTPDLAGGALTIGASSAKIALTNTSTVLSGTCPNSAAILDKVNWGSGANCPEGTAAGATSNTTAVLRKNAGCEDSNNNSLDFAILAPAPRNSATAALVCAAALNEKDVAAELDYCNLQFPTSTSVSLAVSTQTEMIYAQVYEAGVTDPAGPAASLIAQIGYGPTTVNPENQAGWTWTNATFNVQAGNNDEWQAQLTAPAVGTYYYTARFSFDGLSWTYCDLNGAGSNAGLTFEIAQLPVLTVTQ